MSKDLEGRRHRGPPKPGVLYHGGTDDASARSYQNHLLTVFHYGSKVAGLLILPPAWVPPFAALPAWVSDEWQSGGDAWVEAVRRQGILFSDIIRHVSDNGQHGIILRSSAVGEGLEDRGQYRSIVLSSATSEGEVISALDEIYTEWLDKSRHLNMGVCVQRYVEPEISGHVSNELHLSATRNQWKYELERPTYVPNRGLNSKFAYSPPESEPPRVSTQRNLARALRGVCHWVNLRIGTRSHVEWCVSANQLWVLQLDEEIPTSEGENPHAMPETHFGAGVRPPSSFSCFAAYLIQEDTPWKKLINIRDFWIGSELPKHRLFFVTADEVLNNLSQGNGPRLAEEIDHLTRSRAVLRTDCRDPKVRGFNLPRTHTVSGNDAVKWLDCTIGEMMSRGVAPTDIAFILHQYIPARAAAWSYYNPGEALVRVDCLWGLPDGLQFLSHDTFELDARTGDEVSAEVRFKRNFLQEQPDGSWQYVRVARQFGRDRVLSSGALRHIALQTVAVAKNLSQRAQIMWFCDLPPDLGLGTHLPWYRSRDFLTHEAVERPSLRTREIRTLSDLDAVKGDTGRFILQLQPSAELVRADDQYLDRVIEVASERNLPIELPGSILGHAYYRLRDSGLLVLTAERKFQRARGRRAHGKLVRDAIPANIAAGGERVSFGRLARDEAITALVGKLFEEGLEVLNARDRPARVEELADVLEVLRGLAALEGAEWEEIRTVADSKRAKRGGFERQTVLLETQLPKSVTPTDLPMPGSDESDSLVPLHNIGLVSVGDGHLIVPFTRLIPERGLQVDVPFDGSVLSLTLRATGGGLTLTISGAELRNAPGEQPDLFLSVEAP